MAALLCSESTMATIELAVGERLLFPSPNMQRKCERQFRGKHQHKMAGLFLIRYA